MRVKNSTGLMLPPSPQGFPLIGHLHLLKLPLHKSLQELAQTYGPIFYLKMGCVPTMVVSSSQWAKEFLHIHERDFANRPQGEASKRFFYDNKTLVMMDHGPQWREWRRLYTQHLLSSKKIEMFKGVRMEEVAMAMLELLESRKGVEVRKVAFYAVGNMMTRMLLNKRLFGSGNASSRFEEMVEEMAVLFGAPIISDLIPGLAWLDLGGYKHRMLRLSHLLDTFLEHILVERLGEVCNINSNATIITRHNSTDKHLSHSSAPSDIDHDKIDRGDEAKSRDFLSLLIDVYGGNDGMKEREIIKGILLDLLSAGTDTTTTTIEWAMAELLRNPHCMMKLQAEIAMVVEDHRVLANGDNGPNADHKAAHIHPLFGQALVEDDIVIKLPYLQAVLKETLRLHPPLPIVVRKMSKCLTHGKEIGGFYIPPRTKLLVNVWALGHDPTTWGEDVQSFHPDRFLNDHNPIDLRGQCYDFLPFGSGRRGCPGMNLGLSMVGLVLANFVHFFDWKLPCDFILDLSEAASRTAPMSVPLRAIPLRKPS
ncbi:hypothetical protein GOP47_0027356 [Adiantum capillus-veneris]|nr:hypothetical protein GOP47_0027356 [Adiantum capillus-veneris]